MLQLCDDGQAPGLGVTLRGDSARAPPGLGGGHIIAELEAVQKHITERTAGTLALANALLHGVHIQLAVLRGEATFSDKLAQLRQGLAHLYDDDRTGHKYKRAAAEVSHGASLALLIIFGPRGALLPGGGCGAEVADVSTAVLVDTAADILKQLKGSNPGNYRVGSEPLRLLSAWVRQKSGWDRSCIESTLRVVLAGLPADAAAAHTDGVYADLAYNLTIRLDADSLDLDDDARVTLERRVSHLMLRHPGKRDIQHSSDLQQAVGTLHGLLCGDPTGTPGAPMRIAALADQHTGSEQDPAVRQRKRREKTDRKEREETDTTAGEKKEKKKARKSSTSDDRAGTATTTATTDRPVPIIATTGGRRSKVVPVLATPAPPSLHPDSGGDEGLMAVIGEFGESYVVLRSLTLGTAHGEGSGHTPQGCRFTLTSLNKEATTTSSVGTPADHCAVRLVECIARYEQCVRSGAVIRNLGDDELAMTGGQLAHFLLCSVLAFTSWKGCTHGDMFNMAASGILHRLLCSAYTSGRSLLDDMASCHSDSVDDGHFFLHDALMAASVEGLDRTRLSGRTVALTLDDGSVSVGTLDQPLDQPSTAAPGFSPWFAFKGLYDVVPDVDTLWIIPALEVLELDPAMTTDHNAMQVVHVEAGSADTGYGSHLTTAPGVDDALREHARSQIDTLLGVAGVTQATVVPVSYINAGFSALQMFGGQGGAMAHQVLFAPTRVLPSDVRPQLFAFN